MYVNMGSRKIIARELTMYYETWFSHGQLLSCRMLKTAIWFKMELDSWFENSGQK